MKKFINSFSKSTFLITGVISILLVILFAIFTRDIEYIAPQHYHYNIGNFIKFYAESVTMDSIYIRTIEFRAMPLIAKTASIMIVILLGINFFKILKRYSELDKAVKRKTWLNVICVVLVVIVVSAPYLGELSIKLAKYKPDNVLFIYPSTSINRMTYHLFDFMGQGDYYFSLDDDEELYISQLIKNGVLNYCFTDSVGVDFMITNGKIVGTTGADGVMPTKTITEYFQGNKYEITCKRVITENITKRNNSEKTEYNNLVACELTGEGIDKNTDLQFVGLATGKSYMTNIKKNIYGKNIYIFVIDVEDLIELDDLSGKNFEIID